MCVCGYQVCECGAQFVCVLCVCGVDKCQVCGCRVWGACIASWVSWVSQSPFRCLPNFVECVMFSGIGMIPMSAKFVEYVMMFSGIGMVSSGCPVPTGIEGTPLLPLHDLLRAGTIFILLCIFVCFCLFFIYLFFAFFLLC